MKMKYLTNFNIHNLTYQPPNRLTLTPIPLINIGINIGQIIDAPKW